MATHLDLEEQEQLDQLKHFWNTWGTLISSILILAAGSVAVWNGYQYWKNRQAAQAAVLFDAVDVAARAGDSVRMEQAFSDLKGKYPATVQTAQAGLALAKVLLDGANPESAKDALNWVVEKSSDNGLQALARLRLSSVLMDHKNYDEAFKLVSSASFPALEAVYADRRGDILVLQDRRAEAIAEYISAYKNFEEGVEYRRLVEIKLNALGVSPLGSPISMTDAIRGAK